MFVSSLLSVRHPYSLDQILPLLLSAECEGAMLLASVTNHLLKAKVPQSQQFCIKKPSLTPDHNAKRVAVSLRPRRSRDLFPQHQGKFPGVKEDSAYNRNAISANHLQATKKR
jgi:hypothetical protein